MCRDESCYLCLQWNKSCSEGAQIPHLNCIVHDATLLSSNCSGGVKFDRGQVVARRRAHAEVDRIGRRRVLDLAVRIQDDLWLRLLQERDLLPWAKRRLEVLLEGCDCCDFQVTSSFGTSDLDE